MRYCDVITHSAEPEAEDRDLEEFFLWCDQERCCLLWNGVFTSISQFLLTPSQICSLAATCRAGQRAVFCHLKEFDALIAQVETDQQRIRVLADEIAASSRLLNTVAQRNASLTEFLRTYGVYRGVRHTHHEGGSLACDFCLVRSKNNTQTAHLKLTPRTHT